MKNIKNFILNRKILSVFLIIALISSLIGGSTLAYRNHEAKSENIITAGTIEIKLYNLIDDKTPFPKEGFKDIIPGDVRPNIVYVKNVCDYNEYIRVKISKLFVDSNGDSLDDSKIHLNFDTKDWVYGDDGYFYYNDILEPNDVTTNLYSLVHFDNSLDNSVINATLHVLIEAEGVQSDNNGGDIFEAVGWLPLATS